VSSILSSILSSRAPPLMFNKNAMRHCCHVVPNNSPHFRGLPPMSNKLDSNTSSWFALGNSNAHSYHVMCGGGINKRTTAMQHRFAVCFLFIRIGMVDGIPPPPYSFPWGVVPLRGSPYTLLHSDSIAGGESKPDYRS
jgi:hypothetical protein